LLEIVWACCEESEIENCEELNMGHDLDRDDDDDSEGPECMFVELNFLHGVEQAVMDTGAKSFWVDKAWFLGVGGTMKEFYGPGATGADGRSLPVFGSGVLPWFKVWGCEFDGLEVRVIDHLPRGVRIFDSANSNFRKDKKIDSNSIRKNSDSNCHFAIRFARIDIARICS
jgi:hypothetical protein